MSENPEKPPETPRAATGTFTVHFEVEHEVWEVLHHCAQVSDQTPHQVAREILLAWIFNTDKKLVESQKRIIVPRLPLK